MRTKLFVTVVINLLVGYCMFSQTYVIQVKLPGQTKWNFVNFKGEFVVDLSCNSCSGFSEDGYIATYGNQETDVINKTSQADDVYLTKHTDDVYVKKKRACFYFINTKGEILPVEVKDFQLKEIKYAGLQGFENGMVQVMLDHKWGYLNTSGKIAIPVKYDYASPFHNEHAIVSTAGNFLVVDKKGTESKISVPDMVAVRRFSESLAMVRTAEGLEGFIDTSGNAVIPPRFSKVGNFHAGLAWAKEKGKIGYINSSGEWAIQPQFDIAKDFDPESGLALVNYNNRWVYVNKTGEILNITKIFTSHHLTVHDFSEGLAYVKDPETKKVGFIDATGEWVIKPQFQAARKFRNGYAAVKLHELWGFIDKSGQWVIEPTYWATKDVVKIKQD